MLTNISGYQYHDAQLGCAHAYLLPTLMNVLERHFSSTTEVRRVLDMGCGNGAVAAYLDRKGYRVTGVDPSAEGIAQARAERSQL
jgi:2-polyprenyl-6-hydroxyphenyl methylase/3-demethylubiquinone-9 3-methyltransferase